MTEQQILELMSRALMGLKAGQAGGAPTSQAVYSPGGVFAVPGVDQQVITAFQMPLSTIATELPFTVSNYINERLALITGYNEGSGDEPDGVCDDLPSTGVVTGCMITFPFGRFGRSSSVIDLSSIGAVANRGIYTDLRLAGGVTSTHPFVPAGAGVTTDPAQILKDDYRLSLFELAVEMMRKFGRLIYDGNPANNKDGGGYQEFKGLNMLVNTGYVDVDTQVRCQILDSDVRVFNANINDDATRLVTWMTNMIRNIRKRADGSGLSPVELVLTMRWSAFMEITEIWPCVYGTYRCSFAADADAARLVVDVAYQDQMRQQMRDGMYLLVDGEKVRVKIDDFITETEPTPGTFQSDIYILPLRARNIRTLELEAFNFNGPGAAGDVIQARKLGSWFKITDGGRFLVWEKLPQNTCIQMSAITRPRLKLRTPQLAGRLIGVRYTPVKHEDSPWPDESSYRTGGTAFRAA